ncbi:MAG TPA: hypothetical protein VJL87_02685 [Bdellovibrionota bacterium]|nr:hypothetical protein [Bdellovibrionota bacterium]
MKKRPVALLITTIFGWVLFQHLSLATPVTQNESVDSDSALKNSQMVIRLLKNRSPQKRLK